MLSYHSSAHKYPRVRPLLNSPEALIATIIVFSAFSLALLEIIFKVKCNPSSISEILDDSPHFDPLKVVYRISEAQLQEIENVK